MPYRLLIPSLVFLAAAESAVAAEPTPAEIARAIKQLADDDFDVRERASDLLWKAGTAAESALREAMKTGDAETKARARVSGGSPLPARRQGSRHRVDEDVHRA
jgi:hypothetical protein